MNEDTERSPSTARVALVTGGARRIGATIARRLHVAGYTVLIHYHHSSSDAEKLAAELNDQRSNSAAIVSADLNTIDGIDHCLSTCLSQFQRIDLLVNNASAFSPSIAASITPEDFDSMINTNLRAPLFLSSKAASHLRGGSIVNLIDIHSQKPLPGYLAYSVSKAGLDMLTRALAVELAPDIRVNGVSPGAILWPEDTAEMDAQEKASLIATIPMAGLGTPDEIASAVLYFAESKFVTGQILAVDGGQSVS